VPGYHQHVCAQAQAARRSHPQVRLEEAHALEAHARFVAGAQPAGPPTDARLPLDSLDAVFHCAVAAMHCAPPPPPHAAPALPSSPSGLLEPTAAAPPGWEAFVTAAAAAPCIGAAHGATHALGPGQALDALALPGAGRPGSAGSLLEDFLCVLPPLDLEGAGDAPPPYPNPAGCGAGAGPAAPTAVVLHLKPAAASHLESLGSLDSAATAGYAPGDSPGGSPGVERRSPPQPAPDRPAALDWAALDAHAHDAGGGLDAHSFDELCHQLILAHGVDGGSGGGGGGGGGGAPCASARSSTQLVRAGSHELQARARPVHLCGLSLGSRPPPRPARRQEMLACAVLRAARARSRQSACTASLHTAGLLAQWRAACACSAMLLSGRPPAAPFLAPAVHTACWPTDTLPCLI